MLDSPVYVVSSPSSCAMTTTRRPATEAAHDTRPSAAARTCVPGATTRSIPRWPGPYGPAGATNDSPTGPSTGNSSQVDALDGDVDTTTVAQTMIAIDNGNNFTKKSLHDRRRACCERCHLLRMYAPSTGVPVCGAQYLVLLGRGRT